jgi:hypothetical protein
MASVHDFKVVDIKGKDVDLAQYKGNVMLIVFPPKRRSILRANVDLHHSSRDWRIYTPNIRIRVLLYWDFRLTTLTRSSLNLMKAGWFQ